MPGRFPGSPPDGTGNPPGEAPAGALFPGVPGEPPAEPGNPPAGADGPPGEPGIPPGTPGNPPDGPGDPPDGPGDPGEPPDGPAGADAPEGGGALVGCGYSGVIGAQAHSSATSRSAPARP